MNPEEHEKCAWSRETEVQAGKYRFYGNHQDSILEAFPMERKMHYQPVLTEVRATGGRLG